MLLICHCETRPSGRYEHTRNNTVSSWNPNIGYMPSLHWCRQWTRKKGNVTLSLQSYSYSYFIILIMYIDLLIQFAGGSVCSYSNCYVNNTLRKTVDGFGRNQPNPELLKQILNCYMQLVEVSRLFR